jgi:hypothetical protein
MYPSINVIKENCSLDSAFKFKCVSSIEVGNVVNDLKYSKALAHDNIPVKLIKSVAAELAGPLSELLNQLIMKNSFPASMKLADITSIPKSSNATTKEQI